MLIHQRSLIRHFELESAVFKTKFDVRVWNLLWHLCCSGEVEIRCRWLKHYNVMSLQHVIMLLSFRFRKVAQSFYGNAFILPGDAVGGCVCLLETFLSADNRFFVTRANKQPVHYHLIPITALGYEMRYPLLFQRAQAKWSIIVGLERKCHSVFSSLALNCAVTNFWRMIQFVCTFCILC